MKKFFIIYLILYLILGFGKIAYAQPSLIKDEKINKLSNLVIQQIFADILGQKDNYDQLTNFSQEALSVNQHGVYSIDYRYRAYDVNREIREFGFGVTVVGLEDQNFKEYDQQTFNYGFPLLGVKFAGYQQKTRRSKQFDLEDIIRKHGDTLWEAQQEFLPFQLYVKAAKQEFRIGEEVEFTVSLKNVSKHNLIVNPLSISSLTFLSGDQAWGAKNMQASSSAKVVLKPEQTIEQLFRGKGFNEAKTFDIFCAYTQTYDGVNPSATLKIHVVENP